MVIVAPLLKRIVKMNLNVGFIGTLHFSFHAFQEFIHPAHDTSLGLGAIGYPMAAAIRHGLAETSVLYILDVNRETSERFTREFGSKGPVEIEDSPRAIASKADVIISMLPGASEVEHVYIDPEDGIIAATKNSQRLLVECSTIDTETARKVASQIQEAGQGVYADAPVSVSSFRSSRSIKYGQGPNGSAAA